MGVGIVRAAPRSYVVCQCARSSITDEDVAVLRAIECYRRVTVRLLPQLRWAWPWALPAPRRWWRSPGRGGLVLAAKRHLVRAGSHRTPRFRLVPTGSAWRRSASAARASPICRHRRRRIIRRRAAPQAHRRNPGLRPTRRTICRRRRHTDDNGCASAAAERPCGCAVHRNPVGAQHWPRIAHAAGSRCTMKHHSAWLAACTSLVRAASRSPWRAS